MTHIKVKPSWPHEGINQIAITGTFFLLNDDGWFHGDIPDIALQRLKIRYGHDNVEVVNEVVDNIKPLPQKTKKPVEKVKKANPLNITKGD